MLGDDIIKKKIKSVLLNQYKLQVTVRKKTIPTDLLNKKLFIEVIEDLKEIEDRTSFMVEEMGFDPQNYEDMFFSVIDNLFRMVFSKEQIALIKTYLYQLLPDKEWDGKITIQTEEDQIEVKFETPEEVWNVLKSIK